MSATVRSGDGQMPEDKAALLDERDATNVRRMRLLTPLASVLLCSGGWLAYRGQQTAESAVVRAWQANVALLDGVMAGFSLLTAALFYWPALRPGGAQAARWQRRVLPGVVVAYVIWGALLGANSQQARPNIDAYVYASFATAASFLIPAAPALVGQFVATGVLVAAIVMLQPQPELKRAQIINVLAVAVMATALSRLLYRNFFQQVSDRLTIARQKSDLESKQGELEKKQVELESLNGELETLNRELAERVEQKVRKALEQARELDQLNARLQERVRERSRELSTALSQMAAERVDGGLLAPGTILGERVRLARVLGAGGMGVVYEGVELSTGHTVAVKVVQAASAGGIDGMQRFLREALAAASVAHPAIVRTLHVDVAEGGVLFQVQDLVRGVSLRQVIEARGEMPAAYVARVGAIMAGALAAAHASGVVHRDVKPGNVMLTLEGTGLVLIDFGISRLQDDVERSVTRTGQIVGTPEYLSPEQIMEPSKVGPATDVYALGVMLYRMLAGSSPFGSRSSLELLAAHTSQAPRALSEASPRTPDEVVSLVMTCLAKIPTQRPDASEMERSLGVIADSLNAPPMRDIARQWLTELQAPDATQTSMPMSG